VAGQTEARLALTLAVICPGLGGVLLSGEKGTAKSTLARGLAGLLPDLGLSGSFVDLPVTVGEDRLAGCIDLEQAVADGRVVCQPGLLAQADGGVLYVDEVNLLPDHVADMLLDAAATGRYRLEREGLSAWVACACLLVGSMNPEEGELRPQLLDRFGLCVDVAAIRDVAGRVALLRELEAFETDPRAFVAARLLDREAWTRRTARARQLYPVVGLTEPAREHIGHLAAQANCAGQRAEILLSRAARALAAWENRADAAPDDVDAVAELVLRHRRRAAPPPESHQDPPKPDRSEEPRPPEQTPEPQHSNPAGQTPQTGQTPGPEEASGREDAGPDQGAAASAAGKEEVFAVGEPFRLRPIRLRRDRLRRKAGTGRRAPTRTWQCQGRGVGARPAAKIRDLALDATLRAAAPHQPDRRAQSPVGPAVRIRPDDLRDRIREKRQGTLIVLVVDASSSMGASRRMTEAKGAVLSFLLDAYQKRDRIAFVAFRGDGASLLLPPTGSPERAYRLLEDLPTGGKTPLAHGLFAGYRCIESELRKTPATLALLVVISDGRTNVPFRAGKPLAEALDMAARIALDSRVKSFVVDTEPDHINALGLAARLATSLEAAHVKIADLRAEGLLHLLRHPQTAPTVAQPPRTV
jgi:magnesium chelatase subunit D